MVGATHRRLDRRAPDRPRQPGRRRRAAREPRAAAARSSSSPSSPTSPSSATSSTAASSSTRSTASARSSASTSACRRCSVLLPLGISFYTFSAMSYVIDVYRGDVRATRSFLRYAAFIALFPRAIAGPILRWRDVEGDFGDQPRRLTTRLAALGLFFIACGMAKKLLIADVLLPHVDDLFGNAAHLHFFSGWAAALGYTLQLYFDFSGLLGHGRRHRLPAGLPLPAELRLALQGRQPQPVLAPLAHDALVLDARLPVHPARRLAARHGGDGAQPHDHLHPRRHLARRRLDVHRLGAAARHLPVGARGGAQEGHDAEDRVAEPAG